MTTTSTKLIIAQLTYMETAYSHVSEFLNSHGSLNADGETGH